MQSDECKAVNERLFGMIENEADRAESLFPGQSLERTMLALGEEYGEACEALLHFFGVEPNEATSTDLRKELVQVSAVALRMLWLLERLESTDA